MAAIQAEEINVPAKVKILNPAGLKRKAAPHAFRTAGAADNEAFKSAAVGSFAFSLTAQMRQKQIPGYYWGGGRHAEARVIHL